MSHQIFVLDSKTRTSEERLLYTGSTWFETQLCKFNPKHACRSKRSDPLEVIAPVRPLYDFQWTPYKEAVVTHEVRDVFEEAGLSGARFCPVRTRTTLGDPFDQELYEIRVSGWGGVAPAESGLRIVEECPYCRRRVFKGCRSSTRFFDLDHWDGSDLFLIWPLPAFTMVTGRVRDLILKKGFTGVRLLPLSELLVESQRKSLGGEFGLTPGAVQNWFDEPRASELAEEVERVLASPAYRL